MGSNPTSGTIVLVRMADAMRRVLRTIGLASLLSALAFPALAGCPDELREFSGVISAVNEHKLFVDSRLDDNIGFERAPDTRVTGKKASWDALAIGDEVAICWRFEEVGDHPVDARADLYAVGCVAYWLLTGQVVFEGRTAIETMLHHVETAPVPPSRRTELAVPESLDRIVLRCLEKDPAKRPPSADALSVALGDVPLAQRWTAERARQWWDVHRPAAPRRRSST